MNLISGSHSSWPADEGEALARADVYKNFDPFEREIPAALLGSDDFLKYARVAGMIYSCDGFDKVHDEPKRGRIKPAAYEVFPGKQFFIFDENGELKADNLDCGGSSVIKLPANSITFVSTNETFRLPSYIAMRFNLRIQHVHRGILLGTGPMVDPGFGKNILIPLHNLTDDDYYIPTSAGLIWVEFTKTSWSRGSSEPVSGGHDVLLPENTEKELREFIIHANQGRPIRSSIPKAVIEARTAATDADRRAMALEQQIRAFGVVGLIALILTLAGVLIPVFGLVQDRGSLLAEARDENENAKQEIDALSNEVRALCDAQQRARPSDDPRPNC